MNMIHDNDNANYYFNIGCYYDTNEQYEKAVKYYCIAIEYGHVKAMYNLGYYYEFVKKNYIEAKKYYMMAIEKNDLKAIYGLAVYYNNIEQNYEQAKKYCLMSIECGYHDATVLLTHINTNINNYLRENFLIKIKNITYEYTKECNICAICNIEECYLINLNCNQKYNHYYCYNCATKWYKNNELKCLLCFHKISIDDIKGISRGWKYAICNTMKKYI
jgi:TPR repeat protein